MDSRSIFKVDLARYCPRDHVYVIVRILVKYVPTMDRVCKIYIY